MRRSFVLLFCASLFGCAREPTTPASMQRHPLMVFDGDVTVARAEARARRAPLVAIACNAWSVECAGLRAYVLDDDRVRARADDAAWVWVDVEKDLAFTRDFPAARVPTIWVIDPDDMKPRAFWSGATGPEELALLLDAKDDPAARAEREATALEDQRDLRGCIDRATAPLGNDATPGEAARLASRALACALEGALVVPALLTIAEAAARDERAPPTDRARLYELLARARRTTGDAKGAEDDARATLAASEAAAAHARTPEQRAALDGPRLEAAIELHDAARAIPALERTDREGASGWIAPARLARAYAAADRREDAARAVDRAIAKADGWPKVVLLGLACEVRRAKNDPAGARAALAAAAELARGLPLEGERAAWRALLEVSLADFARSPRCGGDH